METGMSSVLVSAKLPATMKFGHAGPRFVNKYKYCQRSAGVVYRSRTLRILTDQRRKRMGAGTLGRNGDPGNYGLHVYDTRLTTDTMTMTPNVTTRDTPN